MSTSIYVISQKKVVCVRQLSSHFEYLQHIEKLAVDISDYSDGYWDILHVFLQNENIFELMTEDMDGLLLKYLAFQDFLQKAVDIEPHLIIKFEN